MKGDGDGPTLQEDEGDGGAPSQGRVLSVQSHVVHGYVGNKSAVFPLQLLGFDVDSINSVQFCNHTGYPVCRGDVLEGGQILDLVKGLEENGLILGYTHLLTGYIGSPSFLSAVVDVVKKLKYVCDPVMGDEGKLYVPPTLIDRYRTEVIHYADVLTPNQFEAHLLTGLSIQDEADAYRACRWLHARGVKTVIITSTTWGQDGKLYLVASHRRSGVVQPQDHEYHVCKIEVPKIPQVPTPQDPGIYTASKPMGARLKEVVEKAIATMQAVITRTHKRGLKLMDKVKCGAQGWELQLIQSKQDIERPCIQVRAEVVYPGLIRAVLFDMDGTLTRPHQIEFGEIRRRLGIPQGADILTFVDGLPEPERAHALQVIEEVELRGFNHRRSPVGELERIRSEEPHDVALQDDAVEVVAWLRAQGLYVALATRNNSLCVNILQKAHPWGVDQAFHPVLTRVTKSLDDVTKIQSICEAWDLSPSQVLVVGDSLEDVEWGFHAGCQTCLIDIGASHYDDTIRAGYAHYAIRGLAELKEIVTLPRHQA